MIQLCMTRSQATLCDVVVVCGPRQQSNTSPGSRQVHFHWQSQNDTYLSSKRGKEIIRHATLGIDIHLFVCEHKMAAGKAAPFVYHGRVHYQSHQGSQPMSVVFRLESAEVT